MTDLGRRRVNGVPALLAVAALCFQLLPGGHSVRADEFRVETRLLAADDDGVASTRLTLLLDDAVYNFRDASSETAIWKQAADGGAARLILLDGNRELRTELTTARVDDLNVGLQDWAGRQSDPLLRFAARPTFDESWDAETGRLQLAAEPLEYRLTTQPARTPAAMKQYHRFADDYARLSAILRPGSLPPFPRIALNAALARAQVLPRVVELRIAAHRPHRKEPLQMRSEYHVDWRLSKADRRRIDRAGEQLVTFRQVDLQTFRQR